MSAARLALATFALLLVGMTAASAAPQSATGSVNIQGFAFVPATVNVKVGDSVTWINLDGTQHTSTSTTGLWNSGGLDPGRSFPFVFNAAGTFAYHCNIHPSMTGTVVVQAAATPAPTPVPTPIPTPSPTLRPTLPPTPQPTVAPTPQPSATPTVAPTASPSPTPKPSIAPTTNAPVAVASSAPTAAPATAATSGDAGPGPLLVALGAVVIVGLVGIAFVLSRR